MEKDKAQRLQQLKKDNTVNLDGLSNDLKSFVIDLDNGLKQRYPQGGYNLIINSGHRESSPSSKDSHHHRGDAVDLHHDVHVYDYLYNSVEGLELLSRYGLGMLDETTAESRKKTGGTGPHLHLGKDPFYAGKTAKRYAKAKDTEDFFDKGGFVPMGLYNEMQISPEAKAKADAQTGGANYSVASSYRTHKGATTPQGDGFIRDVKKEKDKEEKEKTDENRKEIEKEKKEREKEKEAQQNFFSEMTKEQPFLEEGKMRQEEPEMRQSRAPQIDIQSSLPNLPNIWQEFDFSQQEPIEFQEGGALPKAQNGLTFRTVYTQNPNDPRIQAFEDSLTDYLSTVGMERVIRSNKPTDRAFQDALRTNYQRGYSFRRNPTTNAVSGETNYFDFPKPVEKVVYKEEKEYKPNIDTDLSFYLKTIGMDNSKDARRKLFDEYIGGEEYKGTASQNITLLKTIKKGLEDKQNGVQSEKEAQKERDTLPDLTVQEQPATVSQTLPKTSEDRYAYRTQWVRGEDGNVVPTQVPYAVQYGGKGKYVMLDNVEPGYKKASSTIPTKQVGGIFGNVEVDPMGMYNGKRPVIIPSNSGENTVNITMEGVDFPVLGVSDEGDTKVMQPGKKYKFKGKNVLEIPLK